MSFSGKDRDVDYMVSWLYKHSSHRDLRSETKALSFFMGAGQVKRITIVIHVPPCRPFNNFKAPTQAPVCAEE
jgi:hypothetical protein